MDTAPTAVREPGVDPAVHAPSPHVQRAPPSATTALSPT